MINDTENYSLRSDKKRINFLLLIERQKKPFNFLLFHNTSCKTVVFYKNSPYFIKTIGTNYMFS